MYREFKFNIDGAKLDQHFSSQLAMQHCHDAMMTPDTATFPSYAAVDTVVPRLHGLKRTMADREADDETPKTAFSCSVVKKVCMFVGMSPRSLVATAVFLMLYIPVLHR